MQTIAGRISGKLGKARKANTYSRGYDSRVLRINHGASDSYLGHVKRAESIRGNYGVQYSMIRSRTITIETRRRVWAGGNIFFFPNEFNLPVGV
jgi:hypothetical protein